MTTSVPELPLYICTRHKMAVDRDRIIMREDIVRTEINLTIRRFETYLADLNQDQDDIRKQLEFDLVRLRAVRTILNEQCLTTNPLPT